jgi:GTPase KRas protein
MDHYVEEYDPTIEDSSGRRIQEIDGIPCRILINDLFCYEDERWDDIQSRTIDKSDALLFIYSITSLRSFHYLDEEALKGSSRVKEGSLKGFVVGNKLDLEAHREVSRAQGQALADKYGLAFAEYSCKTSENFFETIFETVRIIRGSYAPMICSQRCREAAYCLLMLQKRGWGNLPLDVVKIIVRNVLETKTDKAWMKHGDNLKKDEKCRLM